MARKAKPRRVWVLVGKGSGDILGAHRFEARVMRDRMLIPGLWKVVPKLRIDPPGRAASRKARRRGA